MFAEDFGWVNFLVVCFLYKINPNPRKNVCCGGKSGPNATFDLCTFSRVGVGLGFAESVGFINNTHVFQTRHNLVKNRKHPNESINQPTNELVNYSINQSNHLTNQPSVPNLIMGDHPLQSFPRAVRRRRPPHPQAVRRVLQEALPPASPREQPDPLGLTRGAVRRTRRGYPPIDLKPSPPPPPMSPSRRESKGTFM